jgi:Resolvase, N terminal domain
MESLDGCIRVSPRGGRKGESFISPDVQREKIADWAAMHEVEILAWWEEIDQSGAKLGRPLFQQALGRCARRHHRRPLAGSGRRREARFTGKRGVHVGSSYPAQPGRAGEAILAIGPRCMTV